MSEEREGLLAQLKRLGSHSALYGAADVFTSVVNFLLVPLYTAYLQPADYGALALLLLFSTLAKILFRLGLDAAFFRVHYDQKDEAARRRLAGSVALLSALVASVLFGLVVLGAPLLTRLLFRGGAPGHWLLLAAADVYLGAFAFVPLNLLRIQDRPGLFSAFAATRHTLNTVLKVALVMRGHGVTGVLVADAVATGAFSLLLLPTLLRHAAWAFDGALLGECLRFGLPKVPHGLLVQAQNLLDRKLLDLFVTRAELGIYQLGYSFGTGVKFALSAFEPAWQPFVYARIGRAEAPGTLAQVATYAWSAFVAVGLTFAVLARELVVLMTPRNPAFHAAAPLVPVVTLAYLFHGAFLLTSVGIGITKQARYYPLVTAVAAATNLLANLALIPRFGLMGAAWATVLSYAVMAGLGLLLSQRLYPLPFEWGRLARVSAAALASYLLSLLAPAALGPALLAKGGALLAFPVLLVASGFLREEERAYFRRRLS